MDLTIDEKLDESKLHQNPSSQLEISVTTLEEQASEIGLEQNLLKNDQEKQNNNIKHNVISFDTSTKQYKQQQQPQPHHEDIQANDENTKINSSSNSDTNSGILVESKNNNNNNEHPRMTFQQIRKVIYEIYKPDGSVNDKSKEKIYRNLFSYGRESQLNWKNEPLEEISKELRIATLTWNLQGTCPSGEFVKLSQFIKQSLHHLVAISTQECERSIAASLFNSSKTKWENTILRYMGSEYLKVASTKMNALHIIVLCHKSIWHLISQVETSSKATGLCNKIGNKGGIAVSLTMQKRSYLFVNVHLSSGLEKKDRRNQDLENIERNLCAGHNPNLSRNVSDRFDFVFFMGDFNYRVNVDFPQITIDENDYIQLLLHDQLLQEKELIATDFNEGMIYFPPSYKLEPKKNKFYSGKKKRQPAWTDRILFKANTPYSQLSLKAYDCCTSIFGSDHRPVYAQFQITQNNNYKNN